MLQVFEKNSTAHSESTIWNIRKNKELQHLFQEADIVETVKLGRLRWESHLVGILDEEVPKKAHDGGNKN